MPVFTSRYHPACGWRAFAVRAACLLVVVQLTTGATFGIVGDSVTFMARQELASRGADVRAAPGVGIMEGRPVVRALVREGQHRIVVALGNMDALLPPRATLVRRVRLVLGNDLRDVGCVIWVDLSTRGAIDPRWGARTAMFNQLLGELTAEYGAHVARWSVFSRNHGNWFRSDGIHPNDVGQQAYARFVAGQVNRNC